MNDDFEKLAKQAMMLSSDERAALAQFLLASLSDDQEIDAAWADEAERRAIELDAGITSAVPVDEALRRLRTVPK